MIISLQESVFAQKAIQVRNVPSVKQATTVAVHNVSNASAILEDPSLMIVWLTTANAR